MVDELGRVDRGLGLDRIGRKDLFKRLVVEYFWIAGRGKGIDGRVDRILRDGGLVDARGRKLRRGRSDGGFGSSGGRQRVLARELGNGNGLGTGAGLAPAPGSVPRSVTDRRRVQGNVRVGGGAGPPSGRLQGTCSVRARRKPSRPGQRGELDNHVSISIHQYIVGVAPRHATSMHHAEVTRHGVTMRANRASGRRTFLEALEWIAVD